MDGGGRRDQGVGVGGGGGGEAVLTNLWHNSDALA